MAQLSDIRNLLQRDGTSQAQRQLAALDPATVKVDERDVEDFLVFALRFAEQVNYYGLDNEGAGDWTPFFEGDTSVLIAAIEKFNPLPLKRQATALQDGPATPQGLEQFFILLTDLARQIDDWRRDLDASTLLKDQIAKLIKANLATILGRLLGYEKGIAQTFAAYEGFAASRYDGFGTEWNLGDSMAVAADTSLLGTATEAEDQAEAARDKLGEMFVMLYNVLLEIIGIAPDYFDASVTDQPDHEPHIALFIAFLKLYLLVRDDANRLTERHLDFFYKDVLGLKTRPAVPDSIHLFFKLARQKDEYKIAEDTALDAGKDATKVELVYKLDDDLVANIAQIDSFCTVFVEYDRGGPNFPAVKTIKSIYAAPKANSQDGLGAEIEDKEKPSWQTLGSAAMPRATLGFIVASRALLLAEGRRTITVDLYCENFPGALTEAELDGAFTVSLSGEEEWIKPPASQVAVTLPTSLSTATITVLRLEISLGVTDEAVTAFDAETLGEDYGTRLPLIKVVLARDNALYGALKELRLERIVLATDVDEMRTLIVQNDQFTMDTSKPFQPFGPLPEAGAHFYVGSKEVFEKDLTGLELVIEWDALPTTFAAHYQGYYDPDTPPRTSDFQADISILQDKEWIPDPAAQALFVETGGVISAQRTLSLSAAELTKVEPRKIEKVEAWDPGTQNGFLRLTLAPQDFYHSDYANVLTRQALAAGKLPDGLVGAHYKVGAYTFSVLNDASETLLQSVITNFAGQAAAQEAYDDLLDLAGAAARYRDLDGPGGTGPFGFELTNTTGEKIASHPKTYPTAALRDAALDDVVHSFTDDVVEISIIETSSSIEIGTNNDTNGAPPGAEAILPNEPYTPTIKSFYLKYDASLDSTQQTDAIEFIHLYPFGYQRETLSAKPALVPQFDDEGTLYLGIKDLEALQSLSVLFQVAASTADTDLEKAAVVWSYLADNVWTPFEDFEITADTTQELIASGIVTFSIPRAISTKNTRLPAKNDDDEALHWIKAAVALNAGAVSELINAHTQAVKATFEDSGNDPDHLKTPLEAKTVKGLVEDDAAIDSVSQLYDSFGGRPAEAGSTFYTRISERLRHKGRAITLFDYERLVLEQFPGIYKVKCVNHTNEDHLLAPGHVLVAVIPDFTDLKAVERRKPKVTFDTLDDIKTFLSSVNCPFVRTDDEVGGRLHVLNPLYEAIKVAFKVKFMPEVTAIGLYKRALNDAIIRFLSPWAFEEGAEINFGGKVYKSSILNFVEEQDYVDYVVDFVMTHQGAPGDLNEIEAGTPRSILIPADKHDITEIVGEHCIIENTVTNDGIGHMTVYQDFEVD